MIKSVDICLFTKNCCAFATLIYPILSLNGDDMPLVVAYDNDVSHLDF